MIHNRDWQHLIEEYIPPKKVMYLWHFIEFFCVLNDSLKNNSIIYKALFMIPWGMIMYMGIRLSKTCNKVFHLNTVYKVDMKYNLILNMP